MSYWITHLYGAEESVPGIDSLESLIDEVQSADKEHTDVSITHESEWSLGYFKSGLLVWENVAGDGEPRHMTSVPPETALELFKYLASGRIDTINTQPWAQGYSP